MSKTKTVTLTKSGLTAVFTFTGADELKVTGDTFSRRAIMPTSGTCKITQDRLQEASAYVPLRWADQTGWGIAYYAYNDGAWSTWSSGATKTLTKYNNGSDTGTTSQFFNSNNPTTRRLPITYNSSFGSTWAQTEGYSFDYCSVGTSANFTLGQELVLDVPPTFSNTDISFDTNYVYTGLTTASVDVSELSAKYGGYITKAKLIIGTQTATLTGDATNVLSSGTLSILLNAVGTFTPTIIVTDSRGQTTTKTLADITVNGYVAPSLSFTSIRTDANGVANDEGTFAVLTANINYTDAIAKLIQPTGTIDGTPTAINWYTDRALTSAVDWTDYNPTSPVTLYGFINGGLSTELSYIVGLTPNDNLSSGTEITQTLGGAFYTIDFLAGGHGIAFGQPSTDAGFYCNMDANFKDKADVMRPLFDFFYPVGSYYETSDSSFDPNITWGGTWEKDSAGRVTVAQDTADASFDTIGETGGVKDAVVPYHRHSVDSVNISSSGGHTHTITALHYKANANDRQFTSGGNWKQETFNTGGTGDHTHSVPSHNTNYEGTSGNATNANLQPYIVVVRWHRTA